jgi:hypothetical protein
MSSRTRTGTPSTELSATVSGGSVGCPVELAERVVVVVVVVVEEEPEKLGALVGVGSAELSGEAPEFGEG